MIPQIKIAEAFKRTRHASDYNSFRSGVRFAEAELKQKPTITLDEAEQLAMDTDYAAFAEGEGINVADAGAFFFEGFKYANVNANQTAMEFAEWIHNNCSALCGNLWELGKYPNSQACTNSELFAKFEAERGDK